MRVLLAAPSHASGISGIQRHALNLTRCLAALPQVDVIDLVIAPWQANILRQSEFHSSAHINVHLAAMRDNPISRNLWYLRALPRLAARLQPDIVHITFPVPLNAAAFRCPIILSLHDLYPFEIPENFPHGKVFFNRLVLNHSLRAVSAIVCVSDTTLLRLRDYTPESVWRKSTRIFNCVDPEPIPHPPHRGDPPLTTLEPDAFLLCVAQHRRNKNLPLLLRVFRSLILSSAISSSMKLLILGIDGPETTLIRRTIADLGLSHRVHLLDGLADSALHWCYTHCAAVVVPSSTEGFGLPVAEALLAGCRVICSDIAVLREVGGHHCSFVPLNSNAESAFASAISHSLRNPRPGPFPLPHLSVATLSTEYLALYTSLLASKSAAAVTSTQHTPEQTPALPRNAHLQEARRGRV